MFGKPVLHAGRDGGQSAGIAFKAHHRAGGSECLGSPQHRDGLLEGPKKPTGIGACASHAGK